MSLSTLSKEEVQFFKHQHKEQIFDANALIQIPYFDLLVTQEEEAHPYFSPNKEKAGILFES